MISVVIPTLNAEAGLAACLASVEGCEVIVTDGGSTDRTRDIANAAGALWIEAPRGRARQMNAGAKRASGRLLVFLHADTVLETGWQTELERAATHPNFRLAAFSLRFRKPTLGLRLVALGVALRCRFGRGPYGDQALSMRRADFPGYRDVPLMEDVILVEDMGPASLLRKTATTSGSRYRRDGVWSRVRRNRQTLQRYAQGVPPRKLLGHYLGHHRRVCVFCKWPKPGQVKTRLAAGLGPDGAEKAAEIYRAMVPATLDIVRASTGEEHVYHAPPGPEFQHRFAEWLGPDLHYHSQSKGDLGARLLAAFQPDVFTIVIGTDCPDLTQEHLDEAFYRLGHADVVLGPAFDGGYYLLGAKMPHPALFQNMPWSTDAVFAETLRRCEAAGLKVERLPTLNDLDTIEDLPAAQSRLTSKPQAE